MKINILFKIGLLSGLFCMSSCATTHYLENTAKNNYSNLQTGKIYVATTRDGEKKKTFLFRNIIGDTIIGTAGKQDSTVVKLHKSNVASVKDRSKSRVLTGAAIIGTAATAAIILSSQRAD